MSGYQTASHRARRRRYTSTSSLTPFRASATDRLKQRSRKRRDSHGLQQGAESSDECRDFGGGGFLERAQHAREGRIGRPSHEGSATRRDRDADAPGVRLGSFALDIARPFELLREERHRALLSQRKCRELVYGERRLALNLAEQEQLCIGDPRPALDGACGFAERVDEPANAFHRARRSLARLRRRRGCGG
jgi:hypothetical protein